MSFNDDFSEYFYDNLGTNKFKRFDTTTFEGNKITGHICLEHNRFFGSLIIDSVNGYETCQYVHGFPKMDYYETQMVGGDFQITEKIDGTNIVLYPLFDHTGLLLEVVPKTRRTAVCGEYGDKHFGKLYMNLYDREKLERHVKVTGATLAIELYGSANEHTVKYDDVVLDYCLLARWDYNNCATNPDAINAKRPGVFGISNGSPLEQLENICDMMEFANTVSDDCYHEGVVLSFIHDGEYVFYKFKTDSFYQMHGCQYGVPTAAVKHSVSKYFDEHHDTVKNDWENHFEGVVMSIKSDLASDFELRYVEDIRTASKIKSIIESKLEKMEYDESLMSIAKDMVKEHPHEDIYGLMRLFAEDYSELTDNSGEMFNILIELGV